MILYLIEYNINYKNNDHDYHHHYHYHLPEHFDIDRLLTATTADVAVAFANIALLNMLLLLT